MLTKYWKAVLWSIFILIGCLTPGNNIPSENWMDIVQFDKWIHSGLYFTLFILINLANYNSGSFTVVHIYLSIFYCVAFGVIVEFLQSAFIPNRQGDWLDVIANISGVLFAVLFWKFWKKSWIWNSVSKR